MELALNAVLVAASVSVIYGQDLSPINKTSVQSRSIFDFEKCDGNQPVYGRCSDDCENIEYCVNGRIIPINCKQQTGKKYCDTNAITCSDDIDVCYNSRDSCPGDGVFPDLDNCHQYVYCEGDRVSRYGCEHNTVYDYKSNRCLDGISCVTYTQNAECRGENMNLIVPHVNPKWFVFCNWGKPLLGQCFGNYTFDRDTGSCRFQCDKLEGLWMNGKYEDQHDPTVYHSCYKVGNKWITKTQKCPPGSYFLAHLQICVHYAEDPTVAYPGQYNRPT